MDIDTAMLVESTVTVQLFRLAQIIQRLNYLCDSYRAPNKFANWVPVSQLGLKFWEYIKDNGPTRQENPEVFRNIELVGQRCHYGLVERHVLAAEFDGTFSGSEPSIDPTLLRDISSALLEKMANICRDNNRNPEVYIMLSANHLK